MRKFSSRQLNNKNSVAFNINISKKNMQNTFKRNIMIEKYVENFLESKSKPKSKINKPLNSPISISYNQNIQSKNIEIKSPKNCLNSTRTESTPKIIKNLVFVRKINLYNLDLNKKNITNYDLDLTTSSTFNNNKINEKTNKRSISTTNSYNGIIFKKRVNLQKSLSLQKFNSKQKNISSNKEKVGQNLYNENNYYNNNDSINTIDCVNVNFNKKRMVYNRNDNIHNFFYTKTNWVNKTKIKDELNIEEFLLIEKKFEYIKYLLFLITKIKNNKNISDDKILIILNNIIYDLYEFYLCCCLEGKPENFFTTNKAKVYLHQYSVIFLISLGVIYTCNFRVKDYDLSVNEYDYLNKINNLINVQQKIFLLFCDCIVKKLNIKYNNNIWVKNLIDELNNKLIFNLNDENENIEEIRLLGIESYKLLNEILLTFKKIYDKISNNLELLLLYNHFFNKNITYINSFTVNILDDLFKKNIFKLVNIQEKEDLNLINNNISFYNNISTIPPYINTPPTKEYTILLDLDETLIHFKISENDQNENGIGNIYLRPGLEIFLDVIKEFYEIIIFTSGRRDYVDSVLNLIEKKNGTKFFNARLYREHCTIEGKKYIKDLSKVGRSLDKMLIVDNNPQSFKLQRENGILISSYYGDNDNDKALVELQKILIKIYKEKTDIRQAIAKYKEDIIQHVSCANEIKLI